MIERARALNWWTGRISDAELAEWTGMAPRAVGIILNLPALRQGVVGGGRGARFTRRIDPRVRNAVAIVHALSQAGLSLELSSNIVTATPYLLSVVRELIDFMPPLVSTVQLAKVDPKGNWLPTDTVPGPVWGRFVRPCRNLNNPNPTAGELYYVEAGDFRINTSQGTFVVNRQHLGLEDVELVPLTDEPVYAGELDQLGLLTVEKTESVYHLDDHLLVVDGKWIFHKTPYPSPIETMMKLIAGGRTKREEITFNYKPISVIEPDGKTVRVIGWGKDEEEQERANKALPHFSSLLDVNVTLAVRRMKRRALGVEA